MINTIPKYWRIVINPIRLPTPRADAHSRLRCCCLDLTAATTKNGFGKMDQSPNVGAAAIAAEAVEK